jgi:topoisomerase-4 subunit B
VRNKSVTRYCYNVKERDTSVAELGASAEVTRFKGLGEISPSEFGRFIGDDIRLISVDVQSLKNVPQILEFYMGKNTPQRREYIMSHLIREL